MRVFLTGRSQREHDEKQSGSGGSSSGGSLADHEERKVPAEEQSQPRQWASDADEGRGPRKRPRPGGRVGSPRSGCDPPGYAEERPNKRRGSRAGEEHPHQGTDDSCETGGSVDGRGESGRKMGGGGRLVEPSCGRPEGDDDGTGEKYASDAAPSSGVHAATVRGNADGDRSVATRTVLACRALEEN